MRGMLCAGRRFSIASGIVPAPLSDTMEPGCRRPLRFSGGRLFWNECPLTTFDSSRDMLRPFAASKPRLKCFPNAAPIKIAGAPDRRHGVRLGLDEEAGHAVLNHLWH